MNSFFEGPEKKLEVLFKKEEVQLFEFPKTFWEELVSYAHAKILSELSSEECRAYLLSESSLFVWQDRIILITCGTTTLIQAFEFLMKKFKESQLEEIYFERKNEYQPALQKSSALDDMLKIKNNWGGEALRFGRKDDHHVYIYNKSFAPKDSKKVNTLEVLMYGLQGEFKNFLSSNKENQTAVLQKIKEALPGFDIDHFFFEPEGFSFNALKGAQYATMHVTPQGSENYLSFEIDQMDEKSAKDLTQNFVNLFKPCSYDTILFSSEKNEAPLAADLYKLKQMSQSKTDSGYFITYSHFYHDESVSVQPFTI